MRYFHTILTLSSFIFCFGSVRAQDNTYTLIIEGFDWGPGANKVVLPMDTMVTGVHSDDYLVMVKRSASGVTMQPGEAYGKRKIVHAYVSDKKGKMLPEGKYVTLALHVAPNDPLALPIKYIFKDGRGSNQWIDYQLTILNKTSHQVWNQEANRIIPILDKFDLSGEYSYGNGKKLLYADYKPEHQSDKRPLIIWLHGGGEGGQDPSIAAIANKAINYASDEIQQIFRGAYVLIPQSPTFWMQNANGQYTTGQVNDVYNKALIDLFKKYVSEHPGVDQDRIYVGGCSNGGYMSLKLILKNPDFFAAGYISALAYSNEFITEAQIEEIKNVPMWFVHSKDDPVTKPEETVVPLYKRLIESGASNVHFSYYDHVYDLTGMFGGKDYHYSGHWSWIFSHANHANFDYNGSPVMIDGRPVTIMEWLAEQRR